MRRHLNALLNSVTGAGKQGKGLTRVGMLGASISFSAELRRGWLGLGGFYEG